jgi:hypothetical protein
MPSSAALTLTLLRFPGAEQAKKNVEKCVGELKIVKLKTRHLMQFSAACQAQKKCRDFVRTAVVFRMQCIE